MGWLGSSRQLSNRYTDRHAVRHQVLRQIAECSPRNWSRPGQESVKPVCHPFNSTTGGRVECGRHAHAGLHHDSSVVCRSSPASLAADSVTVYSPGARFEEGASRIASCAGLGVDHQPGRRLPLISTAASLRVPRNPPSRAAPESRPSHRCGLRTWFSIGSSAWRELRPRRPGFGRRPRVYCTAAARRWRWRG